MKLANTMLQEQPEALEPEIVPTQKDLVELFALLMVRTTDLLVPTTAAMGCK